MSHSFAPGQFRDLGVLPYESDGGLGTRAKVGLIALASDQTVQHEFDELTARPGVARYTSRIPFATQVTADKLQQMREHISHSASLLPLGTELNVVAYGCTSASMVIGETVVAQKIRSVLPQVAVTDPITSAVAALQALGARRVALLTPYIRALNIGMCNKFAERGVDIVTLASFEQPDDHTVARISTQSVERALLFLAAAGQCDAIFMACTSLRVLDVLEAVEQQTGIPVTTSNHALAWHALRLSGVSDRAGPGRLFQV